MPPASIPTHSGTSTGPRPSRAQPWTAAANRAARTSTCSPPTSRGTPCGATNSPCISRRQRGHSTPPATPTAPEIRGTAPASPPPWRRTKPPGLLDLREETGGASGSGGSSVTGAGSGANSGPGSGRAAASGSGPGAGSAGSGVVVGAGSGTRAGSTAAATSTATTSARAAHDGSEIVRVSPRWPAVNRSCKVNPRPLSGTTVASTSASSADSGRPSRRATAASTSSRSGQPAGARHSSATSGGAGTCAAPSSGARARRTSIVHRGYHAPVGRRAPARGPARAVGDRRPGDRSQRRRH
ncbi:hypothetical protein [Nannocystis pusilla]|uniref:hypothetical protein n=1 Tax=Nannocystis pusilla TaxID=889268 RepID=UPI003B775D56